MHHNPYDSKTFSSFSFLHLIQCFEWVIKKLEYIATK